MVDLNYLKINTGNDTGLIREIIRLFLENLPELKNKILNSYEIQDWKSLQEAVHKAKSSFQILGDYKQAQELEIMQNMVDENREKFEYESFIHNFMISCDQIVVDLEADVSYCPVNTKV